MSIIVWVGGELYCWGGEHYYGGRGVNIIVGGGYGDERYCMGSVQE